METTADQTVIQSELLHMPIHRAICHLAWPVLLNGILQNMVSTMDMIMAGRLGTQAIAAVGVCWLVNLTFGALLGGVSVGVVASVARKYGGNRKDAAACVVAQAIMVSLWVGVGIALTLLFGAPGLLRLLSLEQSVSDPAVAYLRIISFTGVLCCFAAAGKRSGRCR